MKGLHFTCNMVYKSLRCMDKTLFSGPFFAPCPLNLSISISLAIQIVLSKKEISLNVIVHSCVL